MRHWFTARDAPIEQDNVKRFDPLHWTVDFPRPMMAAARTTATGLRVDLSFWAERRGEFRTRERFGRINLAQRG